MKPLISVLVPAYNYARYLPAAIDSVLAQIYPNVEVVVSDNASTDDTAAIVAGRYGDDERVRYFRNETNIGLVPNFNRALAHARGEFVVWLSADDWLLPRHLEHLHAVFARDPWIDVAYATIYFADAQGRVFGMRAGDGFLPFDYLDIRDELPEMLTNIPQMTLPATLFRRALFDEMGPLDETIAVAADWELAIRLALAGKRFAYVNEPLACYRTHGANHSGADFNRSGQLVLEKVAIIAKFIDHPGLERLRGWEGTIVRRLVEYRQAKIDELGENPFEAEFEALFTSVCTTLLERHAVYEPARARDARISVIIPAFGPPGAALRAVDAAAAQTFANVQIVVVDQSPVPLEELLAAHPAWERITYARIPLRTPGAARNFGLQLARGEYLAFLDEDNTIAPDHLAELVATLGRSGAAVAASPAMLLVEQVDERFLDTKVIGTAAGLFRGADDPPEIVAVANALPLNAILLHRRYHEDAGPFSEGTWILEDFDYLSRLLSVAQLAFSAGPTLEVRMRLGLRGQTLRNCAGIYLGTLDAMYEARVVSEEIGRQRALHRAAAEQVFARRLELYETSHGIIEFIATLSGRAVFPARG